MKPMQFCKVFIMSTFPTVVTVGITAVVNFQRLYQSYHNISYNPTTKQGIKYLAQSQHSVREEGQTIHWDSSI